jgi:phage shock protein E
MQAAEGSGRLPARTAMNALWLCLVAASVFGALVALRMRTLASDRVAALEKIRQGASVIDVRAPEEYASGHYEGARNIPVQELQRRFAEVGDKAQAVVVYCASGIRSAQAARMLTAAGFTDVTNAGGLDNLRR